ncbi:MAG: transposase [Pyrinomonadaceae bacterium]
MPQKELHAEGVPQPMPQTHLSLHYHIVFHTRDNRPSISSEWRDRLHAFIGGCIKTAGGVPVAIGGTADHAHIVTGLRATHCLAEFVKDIKVASSKWVHTEIGARLFAWQKGYAAFTVSPGNLERVRRYVLDQEVHHQRRTFKEEYLDLLKAAGVEYDERYMW